MVGKLNGNSNTQPRKPAGQNGFAPLENENSLSNGDGATNGYNGGGMSKVHGLKGINTKVSKAGTSNKYTREFNMDGIGLDSPGRSDDEYGNGLQSESSIKKKGKKPTLASGLTVGNLKEAIFSGVKDKIRGLYQEKRTAPGEIVKDSVVYTGHVNNNEYPVPRLDSNDYAKRLRFEELKKTRLEAMCNWKKKDVIGLKKNTYIKEIQRKNENILAIAPKTDLEKLEVQTDRFPLLTCRKSLKRVGISIQVICNSIISTEWFNTMTITVILVNSLYMMFENPTAEKPEIMTLIDDAFTYFYTVEMLLKMIGMGLIMDDNAYLKDSANWLDCFVVVMSYPEKFTDQGAQTGFKQEVGPKQTTGSTSSLASLRAFRVLRPLKSINSIQGLKILMSSIFAALPLLGDTVIILLFFFLMMAIAGSQLLSGRLKNRCVGLQTGIILVEEFCASDLDCPGGHFCGKTNENPNYGVTNFDNVLYSFLTTFQCVTLEGWSDVMMIVWRCFSPFMVLFFIIVVLMGAFFLLNLTLAVINTSFTNAQKEQEEKNKAQQAENDRDQMKDNEMENALNKKDQFSIAQYITAKIYVKKMIEFLRMRKEIKRIEEQRLERLKQKKEQTQQAKRTVAHTSDDQSGPGFGNGVSSLGGSKRPTNNIILEEDGEDHQDAVDQHMQRVQGLVKHGKQVAAQAGINSRDITVPKGNIRPNGGNAGYNNVPITKNGGNGPTMKGIIGRTQGKVDQDKQKHIFDKLAKEYDIDKIIPKEEQNRPPSDPNKRKDLSRMDSELSLGSHLKNYEMNSDGVSQPQNSANGFGKTQPPFAADGEESGLITSDSDFEIAAQQAGYQHENFSNAPNQKKNPMNLKKDVAKTFKKMLTQNHNRSNGMNGDAESTKYEASEGRSAAGISEIELKFQKKKTKNLMINKMYKEDEMLENGYLRDQYPGKPNDMDGMLRTKKEDIRQLEEFISTKKPKDPFKDMDGLTQKVEIKQDVVYHGASLVDIFEKRHEKKVLRSQLDKNRYLQLPKQYRDEVDPDFDEKGFVKQTNQPYQSKIWYQAQQDSSELENPSHSPNSDDLAQEQQPYQTAAYHGHKENLKQTKTNEIAKRSDIVITSTLCLNLFPKDKRLISTKYRAMMDEEELKEYVDAKAAFHADYKQTTYETFKVRDKDKAFRENYMRSFIHRQEFKSKTLSQFKENVKKLNSNAKVAKKKSKEVMKAEKLKHEQNKRASERRGLPCLDLETANRFLDGKYHEQSEEEEDFGEMDEAQLKQKQKDDFLDMQQQFEDKAMAIIQQDSDGEDKQDEIPDEVRKEFGLPKDMKIYEVNFHEIRKNDASKKRTKPMWSGQDVLPEQIGVTESEFIIEKLNGIRVWPMGIWGLWKRVRFILRLFVKGNAFDTFLTLCVLGNTVTLAMDSPLLEEEVVLQLKVINDFFTWVFIVEMGFKLLALGVAKYCSEAFNLLDGFVVLTSVFEIIMESVAGDGGNLKSLKALRTLRTFRVFRIARLLRMLKAMQQIIMVLIKSASSFVYITCLMFAGVIIYALLGMAIFGGKLDSPEGPPRMNFDLFPFAIATTFQIMTMENWQTVLFSLMRGDLFTGAIPPAAVVAYLISWIFIGNFILLNLFLAVLIDAFLEEDDEENTEDYEEYLAKKKERIAERKRKAQAKKVIMAGVKKKTGPSKLYFGQAKGRIEEELEDIEDLDEDQVRQIFRRQGFMEKDEGEVEEIEWFKDIECNQAIYLFSQDNFIRRGCYWLYINPWWERTIIALILFSSAKLGTDTYMVDMEEDALFVVVSGYLDTFFTWAFIVECAVKILCMGFIMDEGSYFRDSWNQLDGFIVFSSIIEMALSGVELAFLKILRMLRVLRPLRMISRNPELKQVIVALGESIGQIGNVMLVTAVIFLIFSIIGVSQFAGKMNYCSIEPYTYHTELECLRAGGSWELWDHNFDDSGKGFVTLFVVSSLEGWPDVLLQGYDVPANVGEGPIFNNSYGLAIFFFLLFIIIGSFFFLNMFVGVLFMKFNQAAAEQNRGFSQQELDWKEIQGLIETAEPEYTTTNVPRNPFRKWFHSFVTDQRFEGFIMVVILLNMTQMGIEFEGMTPNYKLFIDIIGYIFTAIFIIEMVLKMIAFGWTYFYTAWNKFDFFVVMASIFNFVLMFLDTNAGWLSVLPQLARVFRVLRVTRILKLAGQSQGLLSIMTTIQFAIGALFSVFVLLMLFFFIFAVLGNFFFQDVFEAEVIDELKNFRYFHNAFLLVFATTTGEDWNKVMFDCSRTPDDPQNPCVEGINCGSAFAIPYFLMLVLSNTHVMLNLFILVITQQFEKNYKDDSILKNFQKDLSKFIEVWSELTQQRYDCQYIKESQLDYFFQRLGETGDRKTSLGFTEDIEIQDQKRHMLKMSIRGDNGFVYFNELLYRCMKRKYGPPKMNRKNQILELTTKWNIFNRIYADQKKNNIMIYERLINKSNSYNPFLTRMNYKISFKTWLKHAKSQIKQQGHETGSMGDESAPLHYQIDIEVEDEVEYTSEEDIPIAKGKSLILGSSQSLKAQDSQMKSSAKRKKSDHLQIFQEKMKHKLTMSLKKKRTQSGVMDSPRSGMLSPPGAKN